ncbi:Zinc finger ccch domain-containing protein [Thalictrum thalictroides]|uniref:Zinc finger ccch domain-containing protein n=1 Tax=Thalictrum thalictroides TaxID=46969 RepID=A0A7J6V0H7_THATH|nr:Zinc finger ccch domain-containing protein [Thalictrum thalictroides]
MQRHSSSYGDGSNNPKNFSPIPFNNQLFSSPNEQLNSSLFTSPSSFGSSVSFTPSPSSCIDENSAVVATENRLYLARLTLEYQELVSRYGLCLTHLQEAVKEAEDLREQNVKLRMANLDLTKRLTLLTQVSLGNRHLSSGFPSLSIINDFRNLCVGDNGNGEGLNNHVSSADISDNSPTSVIENKRFEKKNGGDERVTLPKSISIRSSGYLKANQPNQPGGSSAASNRINRPRSVSPVDNETQRVFVPGGNKEEEALEFDVFNQGMFKTELCNKWQQTGACPYGENCQFAHGVNELRPVIRHPRYKTEVCRMVLAGDNCPYGHRCHFRHALTEQERFMGAK